MIDVIADDDELQIFVLARLLVMPEVESPSARDVPWEDCSSETLTEFVGGPSIPSVFVERAHRQIRFESS